MSSSQLNDAIEGIGDSFKAFKTDHDAHMGEVEDRISRIECNADRVTTGGGNAHLFKSEQVKDFEKFLRTGDKNLMDKYQDALTIGATPGSYAVPEEIDDALQTQLIDVSPIRGIAQLRSVSTSDYKHLVSQNDAGAAWTSETGTRSESATPTLQEVAPTSGGIYALPKVSNWFVNDAKLSVADWLMREVSEQFAKTEGAAFVAGNGTNKPTGFLNGTPVSTGDDDSPARAFGTLQYLPTGNASGFYNDRTGSPAGDPADVLFDVIAALRAGYRRNAAWLMNSTTLATVRKWTDANGQPLYQPGLREGETSQLLGYRVVLTEDMPDVGANNFPIAFGDFHAGYQIIDIGPTTMIVDNITAKGYTQYYVERRTGGIVLDSNAIKLIKCATS